MSGQLLEFVGLLSVELPPLAPKQGNGWELISCRVSGRLFFGSAGAYVAEHGGSVAGLVAGVDYMDVERYNLVRVRNTGTKEKPNNRPDALFDTIKALQGGDRVRAVIHRRRVERQGEQGSRYYDEREEVIELVKLEPVSAGSSSRRLYRPEPEDVTA